MDNSNVDSNKFKQLRVNSGIIRVEDAAVELGISVSYLYSIENGWREPGRKTLRKMRKVYKCEDVEITNLFFAS